MKYAQCLYDLMTFSLWNVWAAMPYQPVQFVITLLTLKTCVQCAVHLIHTDLLGLHSVHAITMSLLDSLRDTFSFVKVCLKLWEYIYVCIEALTAFPDI